MEYYIVISIIAAILLIVFLNRKRFSLREEDYTKTKNELLGIAGEDEVYQALCSVEEKSIILRNVILGSKYYTTELDTIVLTEGGIYVIEVKNYSGNIHGKRHDSRWFQYITQHKGTPFYSPLKQNNNHVEALRLILGELIGDDEKFLFHSLIVFSDKSSLVEVPSSHDGLIIMHTRELADILSASIVYNKKILRDDVISLDYIAKLEAVLKPYTNPSDKRMRQHVKNVKAGRYFRHQQSKKPSKIKDIALYALKRSPALRLVGLFLILYIGYVWVQSLSTIMKILP